MEPAFPPLHHVLCVRQELELAEPAPFIAAREILRNGREAIVPASFG